LWWLWLWWLWWLWLWWLRMSPHWLLPEALLLPVRGWLRWERLLWLLLLLRLLCGWRCTLKATGMLPILWWMLLWWLR
jgi:hypothetical protein